MFLGHYGVAFALKRAEPRVSLGTLFLAVVLVDTGWGVFLLTGWERARIVPGWTAVTPIEFLSYPISHSLLAAVIWGMVAGAIAYTWPTRDTSKHHWLKAATVALAVASHWFLDLIVHIPDLPLSGDDSRKVGLGLWNSLSATLAVEFIVFLGGLILYLQWRSQGHTGTVTRGSVVAAVLVGIYLLSVFGPVPSSMKTVAVVDVFGTLLLAIFAAWADKSVEEKQPAGERPPGPSRKSRK